MFYAFLSSAHACMTMGENPYIDMVLSLVAIFIVPASSYRVSHIKMYASAMLIAAAAWTMHGSPALTAYFAQSFMVLMPVQLMLLNHDRQLRLFDTLSKWYSILLFISIVWWLLYLIGVPLPHISSEHAWQYNDYGFRLDNYFLFRVDTNLSPWAPAIDYYRYNGFFLEPGHIGTITAFFLFANKFELKRRRNQIFLVTILLSMSAAALMLLLLGYILYRFQQKRTTIIIAAIWLAVAILIIVNYNGGDNMFNNLIVEKLMRRNGAIEGRFAEWTLQLYDKTVRHGNIFWGLGGESLNLMTQSAGYKVFLVQNGIFGMTLTIIAYWLIERTCPSRLALMMFVLYIISFLQRTYCFWDAFLDPYILGIHYLTTTTNAVKTKIRATQPQQLA